MAEQAIYAQLSAIPALGDRIYSLTAPQSVATPYVTLAAHICYPLFGVWR